MALGITPTFQAWDGGGSLVQHVTILNGPRRHLTAPQREAMAVELLPMLQQEAKERQRLHGRTAPGRQAGTLPANLPGVLAREAREVAARLCGASARNVSDLARVKDEDPAPFAEVFAGRLKVRQAVEALKSRRPGPAPRAVGEAGGEGGPDGSVTNDNTPDDANAPRQAPSAGGLAGRPAPVNTTTPPKGATGGARRTQKGSGARRKGSPVAAHPGDEGCGRETAFPEGFPPEGCPTGSMTWTVESVDSALTRAEEVLVGLMRFLTDDAVSPLIPQIDRQRREGHHAALCGVSKQLPNLIDSLIGDEP
jgi:hypothetical protein